MTKYLKMMVFLKLKLAQLYLTNKPYEAEVSTLKSLNKSTSSAFGATGKNK
jgi:hypothetical protein